MRGKTYEIRRNGHFGVEKHHQLGSDIGELLIFKKPAFDWLLTTEEAVAKSDGISDDLFRGAQEGLVTCRHTNLPADRIFLTT